MSTLSTVPSPGTVMINDNCDYCFRDFGWTNKAICMNCGLENVRTLPTRETAMLAPAAEKAIAPVPEPRKPTLSFAVSKKAKTKKRGRR